MGGDEFVVGVVGVAMRVFSDEELARLRGFPEITADELIRFFTLSPADLAFVDPGRGRSARDRLGLSVQLCALPWLGFVSDAVTTAPPVAVARLAEQLRIDSRELCGYGEREQTRTDHLRLVLRYLGWRTAGRLELKELEGRAELDALLEVDRELGMARLRWLTQAANYRS